MTTYLIQGVSQSNILDHWSLELDVTPIQKPYSYRWNSYHFDSELTQSINAFSVVWGPTFLSPPSLRALPKLAL